MSQRIEIQGLSLYSDLPKLEPFEMMTAKGWFDERNFIWNEEEEKWEIQLRNT